MPEERDNGECRLALEPGPARTVSGVGSTQRVAGLGALRGIAALMVLVHHVATYTGATFRLRGLIPEYNVTSQYTARLDVGVQIFFVLSAYLLFRPFLAAIYSGRGFPSVWRFWWRRLWRILPAYWVALFLGSALFYPTIRNTRQLVGFTLLVQIYDRYLTVGGLAQAWSLNTELAVDPIHVRQAGLPET